MSGNRFLPAEGALLRLAVSRIWILRSPASQKGHRTMCTATIRPPGVENLLERFFRQDFSEQRYGNRTDKSKNLGQKNQQKGVNSLLLI